MMAATAAIIVLSFQTWIDFGVTSAQGTDGSTDAVTGQADGYVVMALGTLVLLFLGALIVLPRRSLALLPATGLAAVCVFAISGYDVTTSWRASGVDALGNAFVETGSPTVAVYAISVLSLVIAATAALLAGFRYGALRSVSRKEPAGTSEMPES